MSGPTVLDRLLASLRAKAALLDGETRPAAVLWTDPREEWRPLVDLLLQNVDECVVLGGSIERITLDVTTGEIEVMGELTAGLIIFGDADAEPLLGVTALESAGIESDPQNQRLKKLPTVRLKGVR